MTKKDKSSITIRGATLSPREETMAARDSVLVYSYLPSIYLIPTRKGFTRYLVNIAAIHV